MKEYTKEELEEVLKAHGVRKCEECGEYEAPTVGVLYIDGCLGRDSKGRLVHQRCAAKK